jgi:SAM-dependent methyltransferase
MAFVGERDASAKAPARHHCRLRSYSVLPSGYLDWQLGSSEGRDRGCSKENEGQASGVFKECFSLKPETCILDLGSGTREHIDLLLVGTPVEPSNVYIADIDANAIAQGEERSGFTAVRILKSDSLPFPDRFLDLVFCSSVIEHVTIPKRESWFLRSAVEFAKRASRRQQEFANKIRRLGEGYFVQTRIKWFPMESRTWLPFIGYLPRRLLIPVLRITNRIWIKQTAPDWSLLTRREMARLFPEAELKIERYCGFSKYIMAIRREQANQAAR